MFSRYFADLSSNNSEFDAAAYRAAGHILVAVKASEGITFQDPNHRTWALHAGLHHIGVVHYHFARPDINPGAPRAEALHFCRTIAGLLGPRDYVVVDVERATPAGFTHDPAWTREFDTFVTERTGYRTIIYANRSTLELSDQWLENPLKRVWDADWSTHPDFAPHGYECVFRQFTDGHFGPAPHSLPGVGVCDVNYMDRRMFEHVSRKAR